jgi:aminoglycoside phosphotransferase (APT) family kinase protein
VIDTDPPAGALAWAAEVSGSSARVVRRLAGGTHAATHLISTSRQDLVLRRYPPGDDAAEREAAVLTALDGLDGWAPRLIEADPAGVRFGQPATLITRLPGRADIRPRFPIAAARQLGAVLARIHAVPIAGLTGLRDGLWAESAAVQDDPERVLTHFDFWSGNVLWQGETLTGVVDWSGAGRAPRGLDVSWCRLDLVILHGPEVADEFLAAYERAAGAPLADPAGWDLFALAHSRETVETWLPNYHDLGRTDLTAAGLRSRHTQWTQDRLVVHRPPR